MLDKKVKSSGLNRTDYLIKVLGEKEIIHINCGNEILSELKRQGNNFNQAVKNCYFGYNTEKELLCAVTELKKIHAKLSNAIGGA